MKTSLDIRDVAIIDAFPHRRIDGGGRVVLNVGCGRGRIDRHLFFMGYNMYSIDTQKHLEWEQHEEWEEIDSSYAYYGGARSGLRFGVADIFDLNSIRTFMPYERASIVIASEVLEHLVEYKQALSNLLELTGTRLILTFPFRKSFNDTSPPPIGHCNYWDDQPNDFFKDVHEFVELCRPYSVAITKIRTKPEDVDRKQRAYLIVVDKNQDLDAM